MAAIMPPTAICARPAARSRQSNPYGIAEEGAGARGDQAVAAQHDEIDDQAGDGQHHDVGKGCAPRRHELRDQHSHEQVGLGIGDLIGEGLQEG
ncbi:MAG: hypothetical protein WDN76_02945 [Alphaproteobacteria bacterium]